MPSTVRGSFDEFCVRLEPTEAQKLDAATKHNGVRDCLNAKLWVSSAFLTGSYARRTIIRPPSDIDLFVVLDYSEYTMPMTRFKRCWVRNRFGGTNPSRLAEARSPL
jgi:tRNA nucleotidyltransferase (CCA-adding enzyme)